MDWSDFAQNATVGLLEAMSRFDPERGLDFMAYAKLRVQGAVFNGVRVFMTGVDRGARAHRSQDRLDHLAGDEPEGGDLLSAFIETVTGLGAGLLLEHASPMTAEGLQREMENQELGLLLAQALQRLPERERLVLTAHYINQVPFNVVAEQIGLTKGRISQIHRSALGNLRRLLHDQKLDIDAYL
jgi:RNA polymerase sigma factor for flagellar operon FliA